MTFPDTPLGLMAELNLNGTWTDVTSCLDHGPVTIGRGHPDESTTVSPSTLAMILTNTTGAFSSKNPVSPYYPYLVRNTPCRISIPAQTSYMRLEDDVVSYAQCPDSISLHITGDTDVRLDLQPSSYIDAALCGKNSGGTGPSWLFLLEPDGTLFFDWWDSGGNAHFAESTASIPWWGRIAVRAALSVATGTVTFYTAPTISGSWTQLGAPVSGTGGASTSVFAGTAPIRVGDNSKACNGSFFGFQLFSGIGGSLAASPDFTSQAAGTTSFTDFNGNTWTLNGTAEISDRMYRGHFEAPEWPQTQDPTGKSVTVDVAGGGLLRRQSQRNNPLNSPMYRAWTRVTAGVLAAYWPMEDGSNATRFGSGNGGQAMYFGGGALPQLAANSDFTCSGALPVINGSAFSGQVAYSGTWTDNQAAFLMEIPSAGEINGAAIATISTGGTIATLTLSYWTASGGSLELTGYDHNGNQLFTSGVASGFDVDGQKLLTEVGLQNAGGGNLTWSIQTLPPGTSIGQSLTGTVSGTIGAVTRVQLNPYSTLGLLATVFGHCAVLTQWQSLFTLDSYTNPYGLVTGALNAWAGEPAGVRFQRLCGEEGIPFRAIGDMNTTVLMGVQTAETLTELLQECADADRGVWYELRQQLGWGYVARSALYNQAAQVTVDYDQDHLTMWASSPVEDDQVIVNDVTVTQNADGTSSRQYAATTQAITGGRLSTAAPPDGAGTYDQVYNVNLYNDDDLDSEAGWILHVGTVDQPRFPGIVFDLTDRDLQPWWWDILGLDLAQRLVISNPPPWLGPDPVSQLAQQATENLWTYQMDITVCGVPELPYEVMQTGSFHIDTDGTTLTSAVSSTATSLSFTTAAGYPLWTTSAGDFPFNVMVAGELMTVTNITGASSPQAATVTRSVNGVVKAQAAGASVSVWPPPVIGL
jgi:hypothetical protein